MDKNIHVKIRDVSKIYNNKTQALKNINMDVEEGEIMVLLGPSGCGKSTLLRIIGGLHKQTTGSIYFYDEEISNLPPEKRGVGFVFQSYALFPTMTVRENISFGLKLKKLPKKEINQKVDSLLEMVGLKNLGNRKPSQLSGGEQQRVALARVLAIEPKVLLMDEPLTALDAKLKDHLKIELSSMFRRFGITTIYVTHDQSEAMYMADRIAIINNGSIEQLGTPKEIYSSPATDFVAQFIGKINKTKGRLNEDGTVTICFTNIQSNIKGQTKDVDVFIRPEALSLSNETTMGSFEGIIVQNVFLGKTQVIVVDSNGAQLQMEIDSSVDASVGKKLWIQIDSDKVHVF